MSNRDAQKGQRLRAEVMKPSPLSFDDAQARLPELVMAELAGENVDSSFADVLLAFSHYPALVFQYELLLQELDSDLGDSSTVPDATQVTQFVPGRQRSNAGIVMRHLHEQVRGFLLQLMPMPLPAPSVGRLSEELPEYISEWISNAQESVLLTVGLQSLDSHSWNLVVLLIPDGPNNWQVTATIGGTTLPVSRRDPYETYFGPLDAVPTEAITLVCRPELG